MPNVQSTQEHAEIAYEFAAAPEGWAAVAGLAAVVLACAIVVWLYRREGRIGVSPRLRLALAGIRCAVIVILAWIAIEPVRVKYLRRIVESYTLLLVDDSASMDLHDRYADEGLAENVRTVVNRKEITNLPRSAVVSAVLSRDNRSFLRTLADRNRIRIHTFSDSVRLQSLIGSARDKQNEPAAAISSGGGGVKPALIPSNIADLSTDFPARGPSTNIESAVRHAVDSVGVSPVAAIVVMSDGVFNQGGPATAVGEFAASRGIPIHAVGIGDWNPIKNARVGEFVAPATVFQDDPFAITVQLSAEGMDGRLLRGRLRERAPDDTNDDRVVESRSIRVGDGGRVEAQSFERKPTGPGRFAYTFEILPEEDESIPEDNAKQASVNVVTSRVRVLLIAGGPSWDYHFLTTTLLRDETFDLSCWLQSADLSAVRDGRTPIDHIPETAEELFPYDVIILMDVDETQMPPAWANLAARFVTEQNGGLVLAAARAFTPIFMRSARMKPMLDLLPVAMDPDADLVLNRLGYYQQSAAKVVLPQGAETHPIMRLLDDGAATRAIWSKLGEVYWHYPVLREKPAATVLIRHGDPRMQNAYGPHVLAAVQFAGGGRTAFLAFGSTWRWRRTSDEAFDRFWVQMLRYVAEGKLLGTAGQGALLTDNDEYALGESITVTARLLDRRYEPLKSDAIAALYEIDGQTTDLTLQRVADQPGWFEGRFLPDRTGVYNVRITAAGDGLSNATAYQREVRVIRPNLETMRPQMDRAAMTTLAERSAGGRYFEVQDAANIAEAIPDRHEETSVRTRPTMIWDNSIVLGLLIVLLGVEWSVRRWNRLL